MLCLYSTTHNGLHLTKCKEHPPLKTSPSLCRASTELMSHAYSSQQWKKCPLFFRNKMYGTGDAGLIFIPLPVNINRRPIFDAVMAIFLSHRVKSIRYFALKVTSNRWEKNTRKELSRLLDIFKILYHKGWLKILISLICAFKLHLLTFNFHQ